MIRRLRLDRRLQPDNAEPETGLDAGKAPERRTLILVLAINLSQAVVAGVVGVVADSTGLLGAALDNLSDAAVYVVSIYAAGRTLVAKARAATLSGVLLTILGFVLLGEVLRRFFTGSDPVGIAMIVTAAANAATNLVALRLLQTHREAGVHVKASWTFTINDMAVNIGVVISGLAIMLLDSGLPDLLIGLAVVAVVVHGGWEILSQARQAQRAAGERHDARVHGHDIT